MFQRSRIRFFFSKLFKASILSFLCTPAFAATDDGSFAARGIGAQACASLIQSLEAPDNALATEQFAAWLSGYLSALNRQQPGTFDVMPIHDIYGVATLVLRICQQNESALVETVSARLIAGLSDHAVLESAPLVTVEHEGNSVQMRPEVMLSLQEALVRRDFLDATYASGQYGPRTRAGLIEFQNSIGVSATGIPDPVTLFVLLFDGE